MNVKLPGVRGLEADGGQPDADVEARVRLHFAPLAAGDVSPDVVAVVARLVEMRPAQRRLALPILRGRGFQPGLALAAIAVAIALVAGGLAVRPSPDVAAPPTTVRTAPVPTAAPQPSASPVESSAPPPATFVPARLVAPPSDIPGYGLVSLEPAALRTISDPAFVDGPPPAGATDGTVYVTWVADNPATAVAGDDAIAVLTLATGTTRYLPVPDPDPGEVPWVSDIRLAGSEAFWITTVRRNQEDQQDRYGAVNLDTGAVRDVAQVGYPDLAPILQTGVTTTAILSTRAGSDWVVAMEMQESNPASPAPGCERTLTGPVTWRIIAAHRPTSATTQDVRTLDQGVSRIPFAPNNPTTTCVEPAAPVLVANGDRIAYQVEDATADRPHGSRVVVRQIAGTGIERSIPTEAQVTQVILADRFVAWLEVTLRDGATSPHDGTARVGYVLLDDDTVTPHFVSVPGRTLQGSVLLGSAGGLLTIEQGDPDWQALVALDGTVTVISDAGSTPVVASASRPGCRIVDQDGSHLLLACLFTAGTGNDATIETALAVWDRDQGLRFLAGLLNPDSDARLSHGWLLASQVTGSQGSWVSRIATAIPYSALGW